MLGTNNADIIEDNDNLLRILAFSIYDTKSVNILIYVTKK